MSASNDTTTTGQHQFVGWVPPPRQRGTINIIWSCLSVLLICSYKCIHLNIPREREVHAGWHSWKWLPYFPEQPRLHMMLRKLKWMTTIIIAPEIGVGLAIMQWVNATEAVWRARLVGRSESFNADLWLHSKTQRARGVSLDGGGGSATAAAGNNENGARGGLTTSHGFYANMGGFVLINVRTESGTQRLVKRRVKLPEYVRILKYCTLTEPPETHDLFLRTESEIKLLSKSDAFSKLFAILQSTSLVVECIGRASVGLSISLFELSTAAYVLCAAIMYGFWWFKPYDAEQVTFLFIKDYPNPALEHPEEGKKDMVENMYHDVTYDTLSHLITDAPFLLGGNPKQGRESDTPEEVWDHEKHIQRNRVLASLTFYVVAVAFGAIHLAAWNWEYPSEAVKWLWRVLSLVSTALPIIIPFFFKVAGWADSMPMAGAVLVVGLSAYLLSRLGIIALVLYSLSSMPAKVYETVSWKDYFPFLS